MLYHQFVFSASSRTDLDDDVVDDDVTSSSAPDVVEIIVFICFGGVALCVESLQRVPSVASLDHPKALCSRKATVRKTNGDER